MTSNTYTLSQLKKIKNIVVKDNIKNIEKIIFPNDVQIGAGSILPSKLNVGGEIKGYIHTLSDETSYLIAGSNITIASQSNGSLLISSTGGGSGSPGGSDTQIQFNDGGTFGGDSGLTYNKTTDTLTVANLDITDSPATGFVPKCQWFNEHFWLGSAPAGNPTVDLHLEWNDGGVTNNDAENFSNNVYWKYFPYGGEIVSVYANGSSVADSSPANPFTQDMVIMLWTWTDAFVSDANPHTSGLVGHMTASADDIYGQDGGSYKHRALYNFADSTKNGSFVIPSGQIAALSVKGEGTGSGFGYLNISIVYKMNLK